jgi:predicted nucleotidyltransferase component of viral defense system
VLDAGETEIVQNIFGASMMQVRRDHAISHVLAAIQNLSHQIVFFGGTALSRTLLNDGRLSEDIDLYSSDPQTVSRELDEIPDLIEEEFPQSSWQKPPSQSKDAESIILNCDPGLHIQVQLVDSRSRQWQKIPTKMTDIHQRYSDVPKTRMHTPTFDGFVAMKALAWFDRRTARDLFDLDALSKIGRVTDATRELIMDMRGYQISTEMMDRRVSGDWQLELAHQTRLDKTEERCIAQVMNWWSGNDE